MKSAILVKFVIILSHILDMSKAYRDCTKISQLETFF